MNWVTRETGYLIVSGAGTARRVPDIIAGLATIFPHLVTVLTPNAQQIVSPRELALVPGHRIVESYFDDAILPRPPDGLVVVAPCSFNTLNKLALGIADNLALSIVSEAIGRGNPIVVACSLNDPLWRHPRAQTSALDLRSWGLQVLDPVEDDRGHLTMVETQVIVETARRALSPGITPSRSTSS